MVAFTDDPSYWRIRAKQVRTQAKNVHDLWNRHELMQIANAYDRMARHARTRTAVDTVDVQSMSRI